MGFAHLSLALTSLFACAPEPELPPDVVARVSGQAIPTGAYVAALATLSVQERTGTVTASHRQRVLDALIDDALLREQAAEAGLYPLDRQPAAAALDAHLQALPAPTDAALLAWYREHPEAFARDPSWEVEALRFTGPNAEQQARIARFDADTPRLEVPPGPVPFGALEQVVGPTAARAATHLRPGEVAPPSRYASGWIVVRLVSMTPGEPASFDEVRPAVLALATAEARGLERARYLTTLRNRADIQVNRSVRDAPLPPEALAAAARREAGR